MTRIVIIGGGPAGYEAALVAAQLGAQVTLAERDGLGGACVLTDCVPSKALIEVSSTVTVLNGSMGQFVYVVKPDNTVTVRPVKIGPVDGERTSIKSGLQVGERVVIDGSDRLKEGAKITIPAEHPAGASGASGASGAAGASWAAGASGASGTHAHRHRHASQASSQ